MKQQKEMKDAEIWVQVVVEEKKDSFGRLVQKFVWQRLDAPLELGSTKNPKNQRVIGFKVVNSDEPIDMASFREGFGRFFKGMF